MRHRLDDYRASREKVGIVVERVYFTKAPMGDMVTAYTEYSEGDHASGYAEVMDAFSNSSQTGSFTTVDVFDRDSATRAVVLHGLELPGLLTRLAGTRRLMVDYAVVCGKRRTGFGFPLPILEGMNTRWHEVCAALEGDRRGEFEDFNRRNDFSVHRLGLIHAPGQDIACAYIEGEASQLREAFGNDGPFEVWLAGELREIHGIDLREGLPSTPEIVWNWVKSDAPDSA